MPENPQSLTERVISSTLVAGFYLFMIAWFIATSRSAHHTLVYIAFLLPALAHLVWSLADRAPQAFSLRDPAFLSLTVFLGYMVVSTLWSDIADPVELYIKRLAQTLLFIYGVCIICRYYTVHFKRAILIALILHAPWLAYNVIAQPEGAFLQDRFRGAHAGLHYLLTGALLGGYLVLGSQLLLERLRHSRFDWQMLTLIVLLGAVFYGVLLTESRSALLALAVTAGYWLATTPHITRYKWPALICGTAIALMLAPYAELFISRGFSQRFEIWSATLEMIAQKPWLGHGFDAEYILPVSSGEELYDAHNIHLEVFFEGGIVGGILWLIFVGTLCNKAWQHRHGEMGKMLAALLIYSFCVKFFESRGILSRPTEFWHLFWLCTGMALALPRISMRSCESNHAQTSAG